MNEILKKMITHNFCINSLEEIVQDKSILKFKAVVMDFKKSHNGWAVSKDTVNKYKNSIIGKHIVTRYYSEDENDGMDAFGDHEPDTTVLRGSNGNVIIPTTNTRSIGTITDAYIAPLDTNNSLSEEVFWCEGILLAWDNINECSLLLEWTNNNIPILTSVEWYYTQNMIDNDGTEWIVDPIFSALTILNSEQRGNKDIVYGNYDCSHIELMLNNNHYKEFNNAIIEDINKDYEREGEGMENIFLKALNEISVGEARQKIYSVLAKVMTAEEYNSMYISDWDMFDTYFLYETYKDEKWAKFKVEYSKNEADEIIVDFENRKQVVREEVLVEVSESEKAVNSVKTEKDELEIKLNKANDDLEAVRGELLTSKNEQTELVNSLAAMKADNEKLKESEKELQEIKYNQKLEETKQLYKVDFEKFNSIERFNSEEVQSLIEDILDSEKEMNAVIKIKDIILDCAKSYVPTSKGLNSKTDMGGIFEGSKDLGNLKKNNKSYVETYGFDING